MNTPICLHSQLLAFNCLQADRSIAHFKWDTEWDTLWATTRIQAPLMPDEMGYKAGLSVSFTSYKTPTILRISYSVKHINQLHSVHIIPSPIG